jgi:uncharacterized integral membrane protein
MRKVRIAIIALLLLLVAIFILQNWEPVSIRFLFWHLELPRLVLACLLMLVGFILGFFSTGIGRKLQ